jgi:hypothetical protein
MRCFEVTLITNSKEIEEKLKINEVACECRLSTLFLLVKLFTNLTNTIIKTLITL